MSDNLTSDLGTQCTRLESEVADLRKQLAAEQAQKVLLRDALLAYQNAGFGNSLDFRLQGVAYDLSVEALAQTSPTSALAAVIAEARITTLNEVSDKASVGTLSDFFSWLNEQRKEQPK